MMTPEAEKEKIIIRRAVEIALRLALIGLLIYWCYAILKPFADIVIWSVLFAIALYPVFDWVQKKLKVNKTVASLLVTVAMMLIFIVPVLLFASSMYDGITYLQQQYETNKTLLPFATEDIANLPVIGPFIYEKWNSLSTHLSESIQTYAPQLKDISLTILSSTASAGMAFIKLFAALLVSGVLLVNSSAATALAYNLFTRMIGESGRDYAELVEKSVRNVVKGILGVAFIQSVLFGLGLVVAGIPAAGLLFILAFILAIIQVGIFPVVIPVLIYAFATCSTFTAVAILIWCILVGIVDNILKPILLGRGAAVPMAVIFIGSIGGFLSTGMVGLFTGAIIFSVGYKLFLFWMDADNIEKPTTVDGTKEKPAP